MLEIPNVGSFIAVVVAMVATLAACCFGFLCYWLRSMVVGLRANPDGLQRALDDLSARHNALLTETRALHEQKYMLDPASNSDREPDRQNQ